MRTKPTLLGSRPSVGSIPTIIPDLAFQIVFDVFRNMGFECGNYALVRFDSQEIIGIKIFSPKRFQVIPPFFLCRSWKGPSQCVEQFPKLVGSSYCAKLLKRLEHVLTGQI